MSARTRSSFASSRGQLMPRSEGRNWSGDFAASERSTSTRTSASEQLAAKLPASSCACSSVSASATTCRQRRRDWNTVVSEPLGKLRRLVTSGQVSHHLPVGPALDPGLFGLRRLTCGVLATLLLGRRREAGPAASFHDSSTGCHRVTRISALRSSASTKLPHGALGCTNSSVAGRVEEEPRAVACDHDATLEPLADLVVQIERAKPLSLASSHARGRRGRPRRETRPPSRRRYQRMRTRPGSTRPCGCLAERAPQDASRTRDQAANAVSRVVTTDDEVPTLREFCDQPCSGRRVLLGILVEGEDPLGAVEERGVRHDVSDERRPGTLR